MSVLIKGVETPTSCQSCFANEYQTCIFADKNASVNGKLLDCPLVPVPPHGRLIDADALIDAIESIDWYHQAPNKEMVHGANSAEHQAWYKEQDIYSALENAPTIIEAEEGEI